jgi:cullin 3
MVPTGLQCIKSALKDSIIRRGKTINQGSNSEEDADDDDARETEQTNNKGKGRSRPAASGVQPAMLWVQNVLDLKDRFDAVWKRSLQSNRDVEICINGVSFLFFFFLSRPRVLVMRQAFGSFINMNDKCSEFISLFIDDHLKKGLKGVS